MTSKIIQIRYPGNQINFSNNSDWSDNILQSLGSVKQLGIYALPGTRFRINQINTTTSEDLIINGSGIFSINVEDRPINDLRLFKESYDNIESGQHFIIIDLIYEGGLG